MEPRFRALTKDLDGEVADISYAGRPFSASVSTGYGSQHRQELENLINEALA